MQDNITVKSSGNTIKLESTPEEVTGGYFDSQEQWHEFGGGGGNARTFFINTITNSAESNTVIDISRCLTTSQYGITPVYYTEMESRIPVGKSSTQPIVSLVGDISQNEYSANIVLTEGLKLEVSGPAELQDVGDGYYYIKPTADGEIVMITQRYS